MPPTDGLAGLLATPALAPVLAALPGARLVGGCVRDALAGLVPADLDLATPDPPAQVIERLSAAGLRALPTGVAHGTVTAISQGQPIEVTTLRRDEATDGRHAEVAWTSDWREDAARRDFTINALSLSPDGALHDYFDGRADLAAGRLRFVGEPAARIAEDYLRILRYFRFLARFGREAPDLAPNLAPDLAPGPARDGAPDRATLDAISYGVPGLARLSPERVWSELKRLLAGPRAGAMAALMHRTGVLAALLPDADPAALAALEAAGAPADPVLRLAALAPRADAALAVRLRLANAERDALLALHAAPAVAGLTDAASLRRLLADTPASVLAGRAWLGGDAALARRLATMKRPVFPLEGRDALALGLPPGPAIGQRLGEIRSWWLAGGAVASHHDCVAELANRLKRA